MRIVWEVCVKVWRIILVIIIIYTVAFYFCIILTDVLLVIVFNRIIEMRDGNVIRYDGMLFFYYWLL